MLKENQLVHQIAASFTHADLKSLSKAYMNEKASLLACLDMLLLALWRCFPNRVDQDHYIPTKADERETHKDHKRKQPSLFDPLIPSSTWPLHTFQACAEQAGRE